MNWTLFKYISGANPYIAKTEKEKNKILRKYKYNISKLKDDIYIINDFKIQ